MSLPSLRRLESTAMSPPIRVTTVVQIAGLEGDAVDPVPDEPLRRGTSQLVASRFLAPGSAELPDRPTFMSEERSVDQIEGDDCCLESTDKPPSEAACRNKENHQALARP